MLDALAGLALLGLVAVSLVALVHDGVRRIAEAEQLERARLAVEAVGARLAVVSWHRLPEVFGAGDDATTARLGTDDATAPAEWATLVAGLPDATLVATLTGLAPGGTAQRFDRAVALRQEVVAEFAFATRRRAVRVVTGRF